MKKVTVLNYLDGNVWMLDFPTYEVRKYKKENPDSDTSEALEDFLAELGFSLNDCLYMTHEDDAIYTQDDLDLLT